jgi:hypothetical protein
MNSGLAVLVEDSKTKSIALHKNSLRCKRNKKQIHDILESNYGLNNCYVVCGLCHEVLEVQRNFSNEFNDETFQEITEDEIENTWIMHLLEKPGCAGNERTRKNFRGFDDKFVDIYEVGNDDNISSSEDTDYAEENTVLDRLNEDGNNDDDILSSTSEISNSSNIEPQKQEKLTNILKQTSNKVPEETNDLKNKDETKLLEIQYVDNNDVDDDDNVNEDMELQSEDEGSEEYDYEGRFIDKKKKSETLSVNNEISKDADASFITVPASQLQNPNETRIIGEINSELNISTGKDYLPDLDSPSPKEIQEIEERKSRKSNATNSIAESFEPSPVFIFPSGEDGGEYESERGSMSSSVKERRGTCDEYISNSFSFLETRENDSNSYSSFKNPKNDYIQNKNNPTNEEIKSKQNNLQSMKQQEQLNEEGNVDDVNFNEKNIYGGGFEIDMDDIDDWYSTYQ